MAKLTIEFSDEQQNVMYRALHAARDYHLENIKLFDGDERKVRHYRERVEEVDRLIAIFDFPRTNKS